MARTWPACLGGCVGILLSLIPGASTGVAGVPNEVDLGVFHTPAIHQGCWQVRANVVVAIPLTHATVDTYRGIYPTFSEGELAEVVAQVNAQVDEQLAASKKGQDSIINSCPMKWDYLISEMSGHEDCAKTLRSTEQELHQRVVCASPTGKWEKTVDLQLSDPDHFHATIRTPEVISTFGGKRIGDAVAHLPNGTTDVNGVRATGSSAVASMDPYRIVATIAGQPLTAAQAAAVLGSIGNDGRWEYGPDTAKRLQQISMHRAIADEAVRLGLHLRQPWNGQLIDEQIEPDGASDELEFRREKILWDAYFSQAATPDARRALLHKIEERYKLVIVDPDFFVNSTEP